MSILQMKAVGHREICNSPAVIPLINGSSQIQSQIVVTLGPMSEL
jgi:hypothetical protein